MGNTSSIAQSFDASRLKFVSNNPKTLSWLLKRNGKLQLRRNAVHKEAPAGVTAIYSWTRAVKLCDGNTETNLLQGDATLQRLTEEIERRKKK
jgi:hypothetical protein